MSQKKKKNDKNQNNKVQKYDKLKITDLKKEGEKYLKNIRSNNFLLGLVAGTLISGVIYSILQTEKVQKAAKERVKQGHTAEINI